MHLEHLVILLPGYGLDHFPTDITGVDADNLLASWTCLWHPNLIAAAGSIPTWRPADSPPADYANSLIVIPKICRSETPAGFAERVATKGAVVLPEATSRAELVTAALESVAPEPLPLDHPVVRDFFALGFCYLQVELLTRQMRYTSYVDDAKFREAVQAAAQAAVAGDDDQTQKQLARSFDLLLEARDHYYPADAYLVDLTLTAPTTLGPALREQLQGDEPTNLLISGQTLESLATHDPATIELLRTKLEEGGATLIGGEYDECELALLSPDQIASQLDRGREVYARLLGRAPKVFGRRLRGLSPLLPQILNNAGFSAALCVPLDGEPLPTASQSKTRWEGVDGGVIECLSRDVLDAATAGSFLKFPASMGYSIDRHHVAVTVFAHWPGIASTWYDDFRRTLRFAHILGKLVTLDYFFEHTDTPYGTQRFEPDEYRSSYLTRAVDAQADDPLSSQMLLARDASRTAELRPETLQSLVLRAVGQTPSDRASANQALAGMISGEPPGGGDGCLVLNPFSFARRVFVETKALARPPEIDQIVRFADQKSDGSVQAVVEVPAAGFAWISSGPANVKKAKATPPLVEHNILRNEYFEIAIHPTTGGIQTVRQYGRRGNLFSQQLAFCHDEGPPRKDDRDEALRFSSMACDEWTATESTAVVGEIATRGRLLDDEGKLLARFTQRVRVERGSRVATIDVELQLERLPGDRPWQSYYASRFAWADATDDVFRSCSMTTQPTDARRIASGHFVELRGAGRRTTILTGGLSMHRRIGTRELDTLLVVRGESARAFRLGVGLDLSHPLASALEFVAQPAAVVARVPRPRGGATGWFFHLDAKNVVATSWQAIQERDRVVGFRARLLETAGRPTKATLRGPRDLAWARQTNLLGDATVDLATSGDAVAVELGGFEFVQIEARWEGLDEPKTR